MKKIVLLGLISIFLLTGCKKELVCSGKIDKEGKTASTKVIATIKNGKVNTTKVAITFDEKEATLQYCSLLEKLNLLTEQNKITYQCNNKTINFEKFQDFASIFANSNEDLDGISKTAFKKKMKDQYSFKCN